MISGASQLHHSRHRGQQVSPTLKRALASGGIFDLFGIPMNKCNRETFSVDQSAQASELDSLCVTLSPCLCNGNAQRWWKPTRSPPWYQELHIQANALHFPLLSRSRLSNTPYLDWPASLLMFCPLAVGTLKEAEAMSQNRKPCLNNAIFVAMETI